MANGISATFSEEDPGFLDAETIPSAPPEALDLYSSIDYFESFIKDARDADRFDPTDRFIVLIYIVELLDSGRFNTLLDTRSEEYMSATSAILHRIHEEVILVLEASWNLSFISAAWLEERKNKVINEATQRAILRAERAQARVLAAVHRAACLGVTGINLLNLFNSAASPETVMDLETGATTPSSPIQEPPAIARLHHSLSFASADGAMVQDSATPCRQRADSSSPESHK